MLTIICNVQLFDINQTIYSVDEEGVKASWKAQISELPQILVDKCYSENSHSIRLIGNLAYLRPIEEKIYAYSMSKYNNNDIKVEIIEGA